MKQITTSKGSYIFVEVPKGVSAFRIVPPLEDDINEELSYIRSSDATKVMIELPQGNYTFLCTTDTITEEIAKGIVEDGFINPNGLELYIDYQYNGEGRYVTGAIKGFKSLLQSHNLSPLKTYAICKQN